VSELNDSGDTWSFRRGHADLQVFTGARDLDRFLARFGIRARASRSRRAMNARSAAAVGLRRRGARVAGEARARPESKAALGTRLV
jgi:hypothetical protein